MKADHKQIERLLKTARGQLDGILKMVENQPTIEATTKVVLEVLGM